MAMPRWLHVSYVPPLHACRAAGTISVPEESWITRSLFTTLMRSLTVAARIGAAIHCLLLVLLLLLRFLLVLLLLRVLAAGT